MEAERWDGDIATLATLVAFNAGRKAKGTYDHSDVSAVRCDVDGLGAQQVPLDEV